MENPKPNKRRMLRRLRADFRRDLAVENLSRIEKVMVEQAALVDSLFCEDCIEAEWVDLIG